MLMRANSIWFHGLTMFNMAITPKVCNIYAKLSLSQVASRNSRWRPVSATVSRRSLSSLRFDWFQRDINSERTTTPAICQYVTEGRIVFLFFLGPQWFPSLRTEMRLFNLPFLDRQDVHQSLLEEQTHQCCRWELTVEDSHRINSYCPKSKKSNLPDICSAYAANRSWACTASFSHRLVFWAKSLYIDTQPHANGLKMPEACLCLFRMPVLLFVVVVLQWVERQHHQRAISRLRDYFPPIVALLR